MITERLSRCTLFPEASRGWKMGRGTQVVAWVKSMKTLPSGVTHVGTVRLPGPGPRDLPIDDQRSYSMWLTAAVSDVLTSEIFLLDSYSAYYFPDNLHHSIFSVLSR